MTLSPVTCVSWSTDSHVKQGKSVRPHTVLPLRAPSRRYGTSPTRSARSRRGQPAWRHRCCCHRALNVDRITQGDCFFREGRQRPRPRARTLGAGSDGDDPDERAVHENTRRQNCEENSPQKLECCDVGREGRSGFFRTPERKFYLWRQGRDSTHSYRPQPISFEWPQREAMHPRL